MLHILEIPHQTKPKVWAAHNVDDFIRIMNEARARKDEVIFDCRSARTMLTECGETVESATKEDYGHIIGLGEKFGWDVDLYRSDYLIGEGIYQVEEIGIFDAYVAALTHDLHSGRVFGSDDEAIKAVKDVDFPMNGHQGISALNLLKAQLVKFDLIPDRDFEKTEQGILGALYRQEIDSEVAIEEMSALSQEQLANFIVDAFNRGWINNVNLGLDDNGLVI